MAGFTTNLLEVFDVSVPTAPVLITDVVSIPNGATYTLAFEQSLTSKRQFLAQSSENDSVQLKLFRILPQVYIPLPIQLNIY